MSKKSASRTTKRRARYLRPGSATFFCHLPKITKAEIIRRAKKGGLAQWQVVEAAIGVY